ncbi:MAG: DUF2301 domain-containing membrane protein [Candidatus Magnetoovum sp. WYHC-5]|nr:DUF2301 domain-containing membrane protein [Candidatus Magnetoovum sp. WYHC-5]
MGDTQTFESLTNWDKITVILYRAGIVLTWLLSCMACILWFSSGITFSLIMLFYISTGLSVFFIHLYIGSLTRFLKVIYLFALICLLILVTVKGETITVLLETHFYALLLLPLAGAIGFITAKEAFCFRIYEGYVIAIILPLCVMGYAVGIALSNWLLICISIIYGIFMFKKIFMPLHYDIGDKSAYIP